VLAVNWTFDPTIVMGVSASAILYALGLADLWAKEIGRGVRPWEAASFLAGWLSLIIALLSPIHDLSEKYFSMHMTQHEILMLIAAPLIVLGKPGFVCLKAFPQHAAATINRVTGSWTVLTAPLAAWLIHAAALWLWHLPGAFDAALRNNFIHGLQHISFFFSAILFWWAVIHHRQRRVSHGLAVLYLFTTAMHTGLLGALLTLSRSPWYSVYAEQTGRLSPLEDQQLGGLIMWIPAGLVYVGAGLAFLASWMRESDARANRSGLMAESSL
jgi:putative membrane protein